ncbi:hypothetical protein E0Z10_g9428 [Xylaria hypoxylon]|uniref:Receptor L-domain domain-containing protein n=1 Tax=Xylaria hypoxylon TaxID=37992 RepID=A0A4Z0YL23_9PEZI|nr:hypothetical protein E0Z10_g9428 [Xylaria hypoxylon]
MSALECPETVDITGQEDIKKHALSPCTGDQGFSQLVIKTDADGLGFSNFTGGFNISVAASPQLQILSFPDLAALENINIVDAPALTQISLPKLHADAETEVSGITYTFTPSISISNALRFGGFSLPALTELGDLVIRHVPRRQTTSGGLDKITTARSITSDNTLGYPGLTSVGTLRLTGYEDCGYFLPSLSSVGQFTFTNALGSRLQTSTLSVTGSFILNSSPYRRADNESTFDVPPTNPDSFDANAIDIRNLTSVGANATIDSNANAQIDISALTTVGGALSITNNTNCTIDLTKLSQAGTLSIVNNVNSTIPRLFNLDRADSIHLRGYIDTSSGPNILPSLTFVSGTVTIEPWNADFNCSKLVSQQQQGLINNLSCNGTDNGVSTSTSTSTSTSSPTPKSPSTSLSPGAWAGIGVGIGLSVIGLLGGWLFIYFRRRFAALEASRRPSSHQSSSGEILPPDTSEISPVAPHDNSSSSSSTTRREIYQADDSGAILEKDGHYVPVSHEMYVLPAELPVTHVNSRS